MTRRGIRPGLLLIFAAVWIALGVFSAWESWLVAHSGAKVHDLDVFIASGRALRAGLDPYGSAAIVERGPYLGKPLPDVNLDPPVSLLAFGPLSVLPRADVSAVWYVASLGVYVLTVAVLAWTYRRRLSPTHVAWALGFAGIWMDVEVLQVYAFLAPLSVVAWLALRRRRRWLAAGALGLLCSIKPNFLMWPLLLALVGETGAGFGAFAVALAVSIVPSLTFGLSIYPAWLVGAGRVAADRVIWLGTPGVVGMLGVAGAPRWAGLALLLAVLGGAGLWAYRRQPRVLGASRVGILLSLLALPSGNVGYLVFVLPLLFERRWTGLRLVAATLLCLPASVVWLIGMAPGPVGVLGGASVGIAVLALLAAIWPRHSTEVRDIALVASSGSGSVHL